MRYQGPKRGPTQMGREQGNWVNHPLASKVMPKETAGELHKPSSLLSDPSGVGTLRAGATRREQSKRGLPLPDFFKPAQEGRRSKESVGAQGPNKNPSCTRPAVWIPEKVEKYPGLDPSIPARVVWVNRPMSDSRKAKAMLSRFRATASSSTRGYLMLQQYRSVSITREAGLWVLTEGRWYP